MYGTPGRSLALEIAARLGLPRRSSAAHARAVATATRSLQDHLAQLDATCGRWNARGGGRARASGVKAARRNSGSASRRCGSAKSSSGARSSSAERPLREAGREIDAVVADLKAQRRGRSRKQQSKHARLTTGDAGVRAPAGAGRHRRGGRAAARRRAHGPRLAAPPAPWRSGAPVSATGWQSAVSGWKAWSFDVTAGEAEMDVRGKRMRAKVQELRVLGSATPAGGAGRVNVTLQPAGRAAGEINVDRLHRGRGARRARAAPRRHAGHGTEVRARRPRLWHGSAAARD